VTYCCRDFVVNRLAFLFMTAEPAVGSVTYYFF